MFRSLFQKYGPVILIALIVGLILGLVVGLIIGWVVWPVQWTYPDKWVDDYVVQVGTSYAQDNDLATVQWRLDQTLHWPKDQQAKLAGDVLTRYQLYGTPQRVGYVKALVKGLGGAVVPVTPAATVPGVSPTVPLPGTPTVPPKTTVALPTPVAAAGGLDLASLAGSLLPMCCLILLVAIIVAVLALLWVNRRKLLGGRGARPAAKEAGWAGPAEAGGEVAGPHLRFTARYSMGQDNYEESFSIESPAGGFFGECGVSAAERLGKESPDKVAAFDLWLFDVASRETVTKVLLSDWGYKDDPLRTQLIARGGVILAEKGKVITLETQSLRVDVKVVDFEYGHLEGLPEDSFFSNLTLDIVARMKEGQNW